MRYTNQIEFAFYQASKSKVCIFTFGLLFLAKLIHNAHHTRSSQLFYWPINKIRTLINHQSEKLWGVLKGAEKLIRLPAIQIQDTRLLFNNNKPN